MNSRHRKALEAVWAEPANGNLEWARIEALLVALGCRISERPGSSVTFDWQGRKASLHRPHPTKVGRVLDVDDIDFHRRPARGKMMLRIAPTVHTAALKAAARNGVSLNKWAKEALCDAAR